MIERCGHLLHEHPLRTQLVCMINANSVVNALGPTFVSQLVAERSADVAAVVRAFRIAVAVTGADEPWEAIEGLDDVERSTQMQLLGGVDALVEATARWYLMYAPGAPFEETVAAGRDGFVRLEAVLGDLGTEERRRRRDETIERLTGEGVPPSIARAHALRAELVHAPDVVTAATATGRSIEDVARVFFAIGAELKLDWMERELERVRSSTRMQRWALQAVREDAFKARRDLAEAALRESPGTEPLVAVERFLHEHAGQAARLESFLRALAREGESDLAGLALPSVSSAVLDRRLTLLLVSGEVAGAAGLLPQLRGAVEDQTERRDEEDPAEDGADVLHGDQAHDAADERQPVSRRAEHAPHVARVLPHRRTR